MGLKFQIGDKAVYPAHGVGIIKGIETKSIGGVECGFYIFEIISSGVTLLIPVKGCEKTGIRALISKKEAKDIYNILKSPAKVSKSPWNKRFRELNTKLTTGSVKEVAEVIRDLNYLKFGKPLSFGEKKMLDAAKSLIITELSFALSKNQADIAKELERLLLNKNNNN